MSVVSELSHPIYVDESWLISAFFRRIISTVTPYNVFLTTLSHVAVEWLCFAFIFVLRINLNNV